MVSLWTSQVSRTVADWCLRMFAVLELNRGADGHSSAWYLVTAVFIAPYIFLAPLNGAISNSLPKRWVLTGSAVAGLVVLVLFLLVADSTPGRAALVACLVLVALSSAIYNPTRYALLPAVALDAGLPLTRVNGWIELGAACGIIAGVFIAVSTEGVFWNGQPATLVVAVLWSIAALATAVPAHFPSDVRRPERPVPAVRGFFRDAVRIFRTPPARAALLGLAAFLGLITAGSGAVVMHAVGPAAGSAAMPVQAMLLVSVGVAGGSMLAGAQADPQRCLGLVPVGGAGLLAALVWVALGSTGGDLPLLPCLLLGLMGGLANVPLRAAYQSAVPSDARGNAMAVTNLCIYVGTTVLSLLMLLLAESMLPTPLEQLIFLGILSGIGAGVAGWTWRRETTALVWQHRPADPPANDDPDLPERVRDASGARY